MINGIDQFKARVLKLELGEEYIYFTGHLGSARSHMPVVDYIGTLAYGLFLLGAVVLTQERIGEHNNHYRLRVLRAIRNVDFEKARIAYAESLKDQVKEAV